MQRLGENKKNTTKGSFIDNYKILLTLLSACCIIPRSLQISTLERDWHECHVEVTLLVNRYSFGEVSGRIWVDSAHHREFIGNQLHG